MRKPHQRFSQRTQTPRATGIKLYMPHASFISLKENQPGNKIPTPFLPKGNDDVSCVNYLRVDAAA